MKITVVLLLILFGLIMVSGCLGLFQETSQYPTEFDDDLAEFEDDLGILDEYDSELDDFEDINLTFD